LRFPIIRLQIAMRTGGVEKEIYNLTPEQCVNLRESIQCGRDAADAMNKALGLPVREENVWDEVLLVIERRLAPRKPGRGGGIAKLKARVDIVDFAGRFTQLVPAGGGKFKGRCPLHEEKTASFHVDAAKGRWHCFGACGVGGDVIDLADKLTGLGLM
jgi:hypothetical protein